MNILHAIRDENLFKPFLGDDQSSWQNWFAALAATYGLRINPRHKELVSSCTGRERRHLPRSGFDTALFLTGRRSGKSRMASIIGAYEAALAGHEQKLAKGEKGVVVICAPSKRQGRIVKDYVRAIFTPPLLQQEVVEETKEGFELANNVRIEIMAGDWRTIRGFTLLAAIIDEACYFGVDDECKVKSDTELVRAIRPSLATVGGKLVAISSPYARKGWCFRQWKKNFGVEQGTTLVWNCPSRTMNPKLPQSVVDAAYEDDLQAARSEYGGMWRDDVCEFLPRTLIESLVVQDRRELLPRSEVKYFAFADLSGGRHDDAALCISHLNERVVVVDKVCRHRAPFDPYQAITTMVGELRRYGIRHVVGDNYSAEFVARAFTSQGVRYEKSDRPKSELYLELLPRLCSKGIELLDDEPSINQLATLERRTRSGGRDIIDHPQGSHDDLANVIAGAAYVTSKRRLKVGAFGR